MQEKHTGNPSFSIIIPVYNVERYLDQCMDSLRTASAYSAYEIILVDDGSTDRSGTLCDDYANAIPYVTVIHQKHAGAAAARNTGIRAAAGAYVLFVDADDDLNRGALQQLSGRIADGADFYFLKMQKRYPDGTLKPCGQIEDKRLKGREKDECIRYLAGLAKFPGSACAKLVRRELMLLHHLYFEEGVTAEDLVWSLKCFLYASTFRYLDGPFYYYRQSRAGSVTSRITAQSVRDLSHALYGGLSLAHQKPFAKYKREIYTMMAYEAQVLLLLYGGLPDEAQDACYITVKKACQLLVCRRGIRAAGQRWMVGLFGIRRGSRFLHRVWKLLTEVERGIPMILCILPGGSFINKVN